MADLPDDRAAADVVFDDQRLNAARLEVKRLVDPIDPVRPMLGLLDLLNAVIRLGEAIQCSAQDFREFEPCLPDKSDKPPTQDRLSGQIRDNDN